MVGEEWFYDCPRCGEVGMLSELQDHPTRPMADDLGFCPHCGAEQDELLDEPAVRFLIESYGDNPDVELPRIRENAARMTRSDNALVDGGK